MQDGFNTNRQNIPPNGKGGNRWERILLLTLAAVVLVVLTAMVTFSYTVNNYFSTENSGPLYSKIEAVKSYIDNYSYFDVDEDAKIEAALKAYVAAGGDRYSRFYNAEEFNALNDDNAGHFVGIGTSVLETEIIYGGESITVIEVVNVFDASPAMDIGILSGDFIYSVYTDDTEVFTNDVGLDVATSLIRGEEGSQVSLSVLRPNNGDYEKLDFTLTRRQVEVKSVSYEINSEVGVISVTQFDLTTPLLMEEGFKALEDAGINKAVIDLRDNGGGDLKSVIACASYFVNHGDMIISAEDNTGKRVEYTATARTYGSYYSPCNVDAKDIGQFKNFEIAVLVNSNTASAAELLTAVFRDYKLAVIIGENTFGKGTMQTIYNLNRNGIDGGLKITTDVYFPPCGENYDGVGIAPDILVENESGETDSQLAVAMEILLK